ncbi:patatin family protein [Thermodesulfobacteriota bacterium]
MSIKATLAGICHSIKIPRACYPAKKVLIVEGGGMRGIFAAGALHAFSDRGYFPWKLIIGTSAGAITATVYAAGQIHLLRDVFFTDLLSGNFVQLSNLFRSSKHVIDLDRLVEKLFHHDEALNLRALRRGCPVLVTATRFHTEKPPETVFLHSKKDDLRQALKASAALPIFYSGFVTCSNQQLLDGGILNAIPYSKALKMGYREEDILVVVTRKKGFRKRPLSLGYRTFYESYYREPQYRHLLEAIKNQYLAYNKFLDSLEHEHKKIDVIYPPDDFRVDRLTKDAKKIIDGFEQGIQAGKQFLLNRRREAQEPHEHSR